MWELLTCGGDIHVWDLLTCGGDIHVWDLLTCGGDIHVWELLMCGTSHQSEILHSLIFSFLETNDKITVCSRSVERHLTINYKNVVATKRM